jgi:hypothetical protein
MNKKADEAAAKDGGTVEVEEANDLNPGLFNAGAVKE